MRTTESNRDTPRCRYWQGMVEAWRQSGLTQTEFCRRRCLNQGTFNWWKRQLARTSGAAAAGGVRPASDTPALPSTFAPVHIQASDVRVADSFIELVLAGDRRIRCCGPIDRQQLADVLAVLESAAC